MNRTTRARCAAALTLAGGLLLSACSPTGPTQYTQAPPAPDPWASATGPAQPMVVGRGGYEFTGTPQPGPLAEDVVVRDADQSVLLRFRVDRIIKGAPCPAANYVPEAGFTTVVVQLSYYTKPGAPARTHAESWWFAAPGANGAPVQSDVRRDENRQCLGNGYSIPSADAQGNLIQGKEVQGSIMLMVPEGTTSLIFAPPLDGVPAQAWSWKLG